MVPDHVLLEAAAHRLRPLDCQAKEGVQKSFASWAGGGWPPHAPALHPARGEGGSCHLHCCRGTADAPLAADHHLDTWASICCPALLSAERMHAIIRHPERESGACHLHLLGATAPQVLSLLLSQTAVGDSDQCD